VPRALRAELTRHVKKRITTLSIVTRNKENRSTATQWSEGTKCFAKNFYSSMYALFNQSVAFGALNTYPFTLLFMA
jgi:hypothetical protein